MEKGFWNKLKRPILGLAPMDGVTDAAFRYVVDTYGKPDILLTEFTSVEGIDHGATQLLNSFIHHKTSTPTIAQIFGIDPESFYKVAFVIAELGFDGIDINMGCPASHVAKKGGGAGLIRVPELAKKIIRSTKQGSKDWSEGRKIEEVGLKASILKWILNYQKVNDVSPERHILPVSVKTRIGFDDIVTEKWIANLIEEEPANISLHGRTLRQLYSGKADWDEIGKGAQIAHSAGITLLGNGDVTSLDDAHEKIKKYNLDGVLIGRSSFGNPWIFTGEKADLKMHLEVALVHARKFMELTPNLHFLSLRKHLAWYCRGFDGAAKVRVELLKVNTIEDVERILNSITIE